MPPHLSPSNDADPMTTREMFGLSLLADEPRAVRITKGFTKWNLGDPAREQRAHPLKAETLDEAVRLSTPPIMVLDQARGGFPSFVILETDDRVRAGKARQVLHFYVVKVKREWRAVGIPAITRKVAVPYVVHQGSLPMDACEPRRPFSARTDDPVTGRQPGEDHLIELRP